VAYYAQVVVAVLLLVPRYTVTAMPIDIVGPHGICIGIDSTDPHGVWWWEPHWELPGCTGRSTGPDVFRAQQGTVAITSSGAVEIRFQLVLITRYRPGMSSTEGQRNVRLLPENGRMRDTASGASVTTHKRRDLNVPQEMAHLHGSSFFSKHPLPGSGHHFDSKPIQ
jgi:hypothetical protein